MTAGAAAAGRSRPASPLSRHVHALLVVTIAWGALAFGSVYAWAYWPLAASAAAIGIVSVLTASARPSLHLGPLTCALTMFAFGVVLQLAPLPSSWLRTLSPAVLDVVTVFNLAAGTHPGWHVLSIAPELTATALALFAAFSLLVLGSACLVTSRGPRGLAQAITVIGVLLAMVAIVQKPLVTGRVYGFWTPEEGGSPFGPFVNKNHFAGWMTMALPVTLGLLSAGIARDMRRVTPTCRGRFLWLSSPEASRLVLLAAAAAVMALSLALTLSRSGIGAMLFALVVAGTIAVRRQGSVARRTIVSYLVLLLIAVTAWVGLDTIGGLFENMDWGGFNSRRGSWADAAAIAAMYPLAGTGLNTYGVATLFYQRHDLARYYSQAHNDYLQLAAEGGVLLAIPAVLCVATMGVAIWNRFKEETSSSGYWIRVGAVTGLTAIALQETVEFSLQMPGNAALFAVLCGMALHVSSGTGTLENATARTRSANRRPAASGRTP